MAQIRHFRASGSPTIIFSSSHLRRLNTCCSNKFLLIQTFCSAVDQKGTIEELADVHSPEIARIRLVGGWDLLQFLDAEKSTRVRSRLPIPRKLCDEPDASMRNLVMLNVEVSAFRVYRRRQNAISKFRFLRIKSASIHLRVSFASSTLLSIMALEHRTFDLLKVQMHYCLTICENSFA